jgi:AAA+ ATPase superfamily predicted ATPase
MAGRTRNKQGLVFVGRRDELLQFEQLKEDAGAKILVVYGRRRVGKTTLIHKAFSDR